jgi:uncharacterized membrane protein
MSEAPGGEKLKPGQWRRSWLVALGITGIAARLLLWWFSIGSNDAVIWSLHAQHVAARGLSHTYRTYQIFPQFNHPPLMGLYAAQAWRWSGGSLWEFARWLKLPALCGEALVLWTLWRWGGPLAFAVYAWLPAAILVSSFHGNTDCLCAALILVAAMAFERERYFLSGLLLSASLNVKLLPLFLVPLFFLAVPNRKAFLHLAPGFAVGMIPFLPPALTAGKAMYRDMMVYNSRAENWGLIALLRRGTFGPGLRWICRPLGEWWLTAGRYAILLSVVGVALLSRYRAKMPMTEQAALGAALFLVLTPGFAVQYVVFVLPLLCVTDFSEGVRWGWVSGLFIAMVYWMARVSWMPLQSKLEGIYQFPATVVGMMAWVILVHFIWVRVRIAWGTGRYRAAN